MLGSEVKKAGERYELIRKFLIDQKDKDCLELLEDLLKSCENYVNYVSSMERRIKLIRFRSEEWEQREQIEELDKNRRIYHDSLITKLHVFNRLLFKKYDDKIPIGGIFSLDPDLIRDRYTVADWAGYIVEYKTHRKI